MRRTFYETCGFSLLAILATGCFSTSVWEEAKSTARYIQKAGQSLVGETKESRLIANEWQFYSGEDDEEFVALEDGDIRSGAQQLRQAETRHVQAKPLATNTSRITPILSDFKPAPANLASIFAPVFFQTDAHAFEESAYLDTIRKIATHLKRNPGVYISVDGHADERASEAYNLALGTRRANFVRHLLIKEGIDPARLFTVSYGKERPVDVSHTKQAWSKNRRVEFKLYEHKS